MLDNDRAVIGGNNPPPFDAEALADHKAAVAEFMAVTQQWLDLSEISTQQQVEQMADQVTGLRGLFKKVDDRRKAEKKPHDEAGKAVQAAYAPLLDQLKRAADALKTKMAAWADKREREEQQRKLQEAEAARKAQAEADERARAAAQSNDIAAQVEAEEAQKAAAAQMKAAERPADTSVKSASGAGRTMATRTVKEVAVTNINVLFMHFRAHPDVTDLLTRLATAKVRAKGYDADQDPIPGIKITERKVMA